MFYVRYTVYVVRYIIARFLIHLGLKIMPMSAYKVLLLNRLWELRKEVETKVKEHRRATLNKNA
jgi:hypothetical protein